MGELTGLEICQRIAEIEGVNVYASEIQVGTCFIPTGIVDEKFMQYDPLTDDALCFRLGFKFGVCIDYESGDVFIRGGDGFDGCLSVMQFEDGCFESLKRAICLAIIKSKVNK